MKQIIETAHAICAKALPHSEDPILFLIFSRTRLQKCLALVLTMPPPQLIGLSPATAGNSHSPDPAALPEADFQKYFEKLSLPPEPLCGPDSCSSSLIQAPVADLSPGLALVSSTLPSHTRCSLKPPATCPMFTHSHGGLARDRHQVAPYLTISETLRTCAA